MPAHEPKPVTKPDAKSDAKPDLSRFVQDGDEGITINGMSIADYLKDPKTQAALAANKATKPVSPGVK